MAKIKKRRYLNKGVRDEEAENEKAKEDPELVNLEISDAKQILFMFSFTNSKHVPYNLRRKEDDSADYIKHRAEEVLEVGINPEDIEVQRPTVPDIKEAVVDTGFKMGSFTHCEGGETVFWELMREDWKVNDAHWKVKESQQGIKLGKGRKKYQVVVSLRKGKEAELDDITCEGILRLMRMTWAVHAWDNRELPQNNVVLNFPLCHKVGTLPQHVFVLQ